MTVLPPVMTPGFSKFHFSVMIIPFLVALGLMVTARIANPEWPQSVNALLAGVLVAVVSYIMYKLLPFDDEQHLPKAIMLGLLHAEFSVFTRSHLLPPVTTITFFMFMFFYALADVHSDIKH
jgi:hypothetical protein